MFRTILLQLSLSILLTLNAKTMDISTYTPDLERKNDSWQNPVFQ